MQKNIGGANILQSLFGDLKTPQQPVKRLESLSSSTQQQQQHEGEGEGGSDDNYREIKGYKSEGQFFWSNLRGFLRYYFPPQVADNLQKHFETVRNEANCLIITY